MMHVPLTVVWVQRVNQLLHATHTQGRYVQYLSLTALKQR